MTRQVRAIARELDDLEDKDTGTPGIPPQLERVWLYGGSKDGRMFGPATEHHMRVRDRNGRGWTSAHPGSQAASPHEDPIEMLVRALELKGTDADIVRRQARREPNADIAVALGLSLRQLERRITRIRKLEAEQRERMRLLARDAG